MTGSKNFTQIFLVYIFLWLKAFLVNHLTLPMHDHIIVVVSYAIDVALILFVVVKIDKEPVSSVGIKPPSFLDVLGGFILGVVLYLVQILPPILFMHMDISQFTETPSWSPLLLRFLFLLITVGLGEELVFRGFLLHKLEGIVQNKALVVFWNCLLFYTFHLTQAFVFDWTKVYSTFATTIVLCVYFYSTKKRSILPLILAHAILDLLLGAPGFYFLNLFIQ